ncbi:MAG: hypothetical protein IJS15_08340 [Victivallales bacterium]|nr:hypothetical protein [Victivallales bacterium]
MNDKSNDFEKLSGTVVFLLENQGSKSEGVLPFLYANKEEKIKLFLKGDNPFENTGLLPYDGKAVEVVGMKKRNGTFVIEQILDGKKVAEEAKQTSGAKTMENTDDNDKQ